MSSFDEGDYARRRAEARQQSAWYKLAVGDNTFRILPTPPTKTVKTNFFEYAVHREVGPKKQTVRCGIDPVTGEGECWLCDVKIPALKKKRMDTRADGLAPKAQLLVQVAKVDDQGKMHGPLLFTPSKQIADQLLASIFGSKKRSYIDPLKGFNISINRTGTGRNDTRYGILEPDQDPTKVPQALLDKVQPFESLKEVPTYSQAKQQGAYTGQETPEEEEDRPKTSKTRRAVVDDDEDVDAETDDIDGDASDDEEEEEEAPKPKKKVAAAPPAKPKKHAVVEDEEEEVPEDDEDVDVDEDEPVEEEEEEAPAPKKKAAQVQVARTKVAPVDEEEEEEAPRPKKKKVAPVEEEEEEPEAETDEDDPGDEIDLDDVAEDDEEEEEAPAPKKKAAPAPASKNVKPAAHQGPKPKVRR